jgi:hypothetical protein
MFYLRPICQRFRASLVALFFLSVFAMGAANAQKRALITAAIDETKLSPVTCLRG